jgi:predicted DNA-binding transcriptional regulator YafY
LHAPDQRANFQPFPGTARSVSADPAGNVREQRGVHVTAPFPVAATVTAIRAGDRAAAARPSPALRAAEPTTPAANLSLLREAVEARESVWLAYLDNHGSTLERVVDPVKVEAGWLSAYDHRTEDVRSFAVHRITAVRRLT